MTMSVGITKPRSRSKRPSQAQMVALWLGTFELLKDETTRAGSLMSNETLAAAVTALVPLIDMDQPWIGRHARLTNQIKENE